MNGQKSRSGGGVRLGFEGGQMPLYRRLPKRGFTNIWGTEYATVNVDDLNRFDEGTVVTPELLKENGVVKNHKDGIKVLGNGELEKNVTVKAHKFSKTGTCLGGGLGGGAGLGGWGLVGERGGSGLGDQEPDRQRRGQSFATGAERRTTDRKSVV